MRYWHPLTDAAIRDLPAFAPEEIVLLPLYPQYSATTTGSSLNEWKRQFPRDTAAAVHVVREFHDYPLYLDALVERIEQGLGRFRRSNGHAARAPSDVHLLFSAHSIPVSVIHGGDPYQTHIEATVKAVMARGRWANPHSLCYQSRSGPGRWLQPFIHETLQEITQSGAERVLVVPIAFVSDHVETLHEINIEARNMAETLGIQQFETMEGLNDSRRLHLCARRPRTAQGGGESLRVVAMPLLAVQGAFRTGKSARHTASPAMPVVIGEIPVRTGFCDVVIAGVSQYLEQRSEAGEHFLKHITGNSASGFGASHLPIETLQVVGKNCAGHG